MVSPKKNRKSVASFSPPSHRAPILKNEHTLAGQQAQSPKSQVIRGAGRFFYVSLHRHSANEGPIPLALPMPCRGDRDPGNCATRALAWLICSCVITCDRLFI